MSISQYYDNSKNDLEIADFIIIEDYSYEVLTQDDYQAGIDLIAKEYVEREPTTIAFDVTVEDFREEASRRNYCDSGISVCVKFVSTQEIVGVMLAKDLLCRDDTLEGQSVGYADLQKIIDREVDVLLDLCLYTKEEGKLNHSVNSAISPDHMGKNIALNLMAYQELLAEKRGYVATVVEATSAVAQNIAIYLDFKLLSEIFYEDMVLPSNNK